MIKLIDLVETKIIPKGKREFIITKIDRGDYTGYLHIGNIKQEVVKLATNRDIQMVSKGEKATKLEDIFKKYNIQYVRSEFASFSIFSIPIKENNIRIIDNISETKVAARGKREFRITQKNNNDTIGDLTIGNLTTESGQLGPNETHISLYIGNGFKVISVYFRFRGEPSMERIRAFEDNLKKYGIKYKLYDEELSHVVFSILVEANDIRVVDDSINETRIGPKKPFILFKNDDDDGDYILYPNNDPNQRPMYEFYPHEIIKYVSITLFDGPPFDNSEDKLAFNFVNNAVKNLPDVEIKKDGFPYESASRFTIPIKYFEIRK